MSNPVDAPPSERSARANSPNTEQEKCGVDTLVDSKMNTDVKGDQSADVQSPEGTALLSDQTKLERQENHHEAGAELPSVNNKLGAQATGQSEYCPQDNDFTPNPVYIRSTDSTSLEYWESVLDQCVPETRLNAPKPGKRDIYGVGSLVIKYGHNSLGSTGDYSFLDENEETAVGLAAEALPELQLPKYYLRTRIRGQDTLVRSRIPGASLDSIWSSLGPEQKLNFKRQAQDIARRIHLVKLDSSKPSYLVNIPQQEKCAKPHLEERDILLGGDSPSAAALGLAHNNLLPSNIIVDNGKIVGLVGWSHTGNFELSRCGRVHCEIRCKDEKRNLVPELWEGGVPWYDLYETIQDGQNLQAAHTEKESQPFVKAEETAATISVVPHLAKSEIFNFPTPQKITDLKQESVSRASSMDRSSPAPSVKPAPKKRAGASAMSKKGQAVRKPAAKKRKLNDTESVDGTTGSRRSSATPSVRGKGTTRRGRKQTSMSLAGSPAPEGSARGKSQEVDDDLEEDEDNSSEVFCICRRPDNHTWMIACDGGCDDWFHGKCVNMKQADADLIDKYICPNCEKKQGIRTTWKRMCRLPGCRQPARVTAKTPSKYCSDDHGVEFMTKKIPTITRSTPGTQANTGTGSGTLTRESSAKPGRPIDADVGVLKHGKPNSNGEPVTENEAQDETNVVEREGPGEFTKGGVLTPQEVKALVDGVSSAAEFRKLGESLLSTETPELKPLREVADSFAVKSEEPSKGVNFDSLAANIEWMPEERRQMDILKEQRNELLNRSSLLRDRDKFVGLVRQRAKNILERLRQKDPKGWKDICGFDSRLSWSDGEFDEWRQSDSGKKALEEGHLEPEDQSVDETGDTEMTDAEKADEAASIAQGVCIKKRCERHRQWVKVQQQDIQFEQSMVKEQLAKCEKRATEVIEGVVLRAYGDHDQVTEDKK